mmetsp:Transcript_26606/g.58420  ORF Transcript_26606/g.58420 Transcript_26606/m.58420 type:complete len:607 (-) Transcript_26606:31-1851(-)
MVIFTLGTLLASLAVLSDSRSADVDDHLAAVIASDQWAEQDVCGTKTEPGCTLSLLQVMPSDLLIGSERLLKLAESVSKRRALHRNTRPDSSGPQPGIFAAQPSMPRGALGAATGASPLWPPSAATLQVDTQAQPAQEAARLLQKGHPVNYPLKRGPLQLMRRCALWSHITKNKGKNIIIYAKDGMRVDVKPDDEFIQEVSEDKMNTLTWLLGLAVALFFAFYFTRFVVDHMAVQEVPNLSFEIERGLRVWNKFCVVSVFLLCMATFVLTFTNIAVENVEILHEPQANRTEDSVNVTVTRYDIKDAGSRSFQAALGVTLSAVVGSITVANWRRSGRVVVSEALLAHFALRGATVALAIAILLELLGAFVIDLATNAVSVGSMLVTMAVVGFSEEGAKLAMVMCGTWISANALTEAPPPGGCRRAWRSLVENRRALITVGMAVGYGFMTAENAGYLLTSASTPAELRQYSDGRPDERVDGVTVNMLSFTTVLVRVLLNIHPWLAGISAARAGQIAFKDHRAGMSLGLFEFLWVLLPAALAHAVYDVLVISHAWLALFTPPVFWFLSRYWLAIEWDETERPENFVTDREGSGSGSIANQRVVPRPGVD